MSAEAAAVHREALLIDGHNDLPWELRRRTARRSATSTSPSRRRSSTPTSTRLRKGNVGAQFWSAYVPTSTGKKGTAVKMTLEQIDVIHEMVRRYPDTFEMAYGTDDILRIRKAGKIACLIGVEGGHSIDNSLAAAAQLLPARRAVHDADALRVARLGRLVLRRAEGERPDPVRRGAWSAR